jgi:hypothetical protein
MLEEEKEKAEAAESNNQQTSALAPTLVSPPTYIVGAGIETTSYSTAGGTQFTQSELLPTLYPNSTAEEKEALHIDSFIQDGLNKDVIYVEATNFGSVESGAFTEFFRVDFSNAEPDAITLFKQDIELANEQAPEFGTRISFLGRDQGKLVFVTADVDDSPGPCANPWLDAEKAENSRTYSYIDLATVNENLDQEDLSDTLTFDTYTPSQAVIEEQTDIQEQCVIDLQNIQDAL